MNKELFEMLVQAVVNAGLSGEETANILSAFVEAYKSQSRLILDTKLHQPLMHALKKYESNFLEKISTRNLSDYITERQRRVDFLSVRFNWLKDNIYAPQ